VCGAVLLLGVVVSAQAAEPALPIAVVPGAGGCLDAARLAEALRRELGGRPVQVGQGGRGPRFEVRVDARPGPLTLEVVRLD
jgi:hypothetical protein